MTYTTLAPTDAEILALLPTVKLKDEDPKRMVWLTRKDALKFVRAVLTKWGTPAPASPPVAAPAGIEPTNIEAVATVNTGEDGEAKLSWLIEGGLAAVPKGQTLFISSEALTDDEGCGEVFTAAQVQAMGRVPPGWQAVPVELDDDIAEAIAMTANCCGGGAYDIWRAALAAAPSGPAREPLTDEQMHKELVALCERIFNARIGKTCSHCEGGTYQADHNGYSQFHRCNKCRYVPMWGEDGSEFGITAAPKGGQDAEV